MQICLYRLIVSFIGFLWLYFNNYTINKLMKYQICRLTTKPTKWHVQPTKTQIRVSAQFDQSLRCPHEESLGPYLPIERTAKTLIRLGGCPGWSESSLGAKSFCWFCREAAQIFIYSAKYKDDDLSLGFRLKEEANLLFSLVNVCWVDICRIISTQGMT